MLHTMPKPAAADSQVGTALEENDKLVVSIGEEVENLERQFNLALRGEYAVGYNEMPQNPAQIQPVPNKSGLCDLIENRNTRLKAILTRLVSMRNRCDL